MWTQEKMHYQVDQMAHTDGGKIVKETKTIKAGLQGPGMSLSDHIIHHIWNRTALHERQPG